MLFQIKLNENLNWKENSEQKKINYEIFNFVSVIKSQTICYDYFKRPKISVLLFWESQAFDLGRAHVLSDTFRQKKDSDLER